MIMFIWLSQLDGISDIVYPLQTHQYQDQNLTILALNDSTFNLFL